MCPSTYFSVFFLSNRLYSIFSFRSIWTTWKKKYNWLCTTNWLITCRCWCSNLGLFPPYCSIVVQYLIDIWFYHSVVYVAKTPWSLLINYSQIGIVKRSHKTICICIIDPNIADLFTLFLKLAFFLSYGKRDNNHR